MKDLLEKIVKRKKNPEHNILHIERGEQPRDIFHYVKFGVIFEGLIDIITLLPWVNKRDLVIIIDRIQRQYGIEVLNDYIIKHQEFLDYRVSSDVDQAISEYEVSYFLLKNRVYLGDPPELDKFKVK